MCYIFSQKCTVFAVSVPVILCTINERLSGWLDRVVEFQKKSFIDDLMKNPKQIKFSGTTSPLSRVGNIGLYGTYTKRSF